MLVRGLISALIWDISGLWNRWDGRDFREKRIDISRFLTPYISRWHRKILKGFFIYSCIYDSQLQKKCVFVVTYKHSCILWPDRYPLCVFIWSLSSEVQENVIEATRTSERFHGNLLIFVKYVTFYFMNKGAFLIFDRLIK